MAEAAFLSYRASACTTVGQLVRLSGREITSDDEHLALGALELAGKKFRPGKPGGGRPVSSRLIKIWVGPAGARRRQRDR